MSLTGISRIPLGATVESPSVRRTDVAEGTKGRALLLSPDWYAVNIAYSDNPRGAFYVNQEQVIKHSLSPRTYYICPIARLNTDANGEVLNSQFRIEYLRLSEDVYKEFATSAVEQPFSSIVMVKVTKGTFSYIKPSPSSRPQNPQFISEIQSKLSALNIDAIAQLILVDVAKPFTEYEKALANPQGLPSSPSQGQYQQIPQAYNPPPQQAQLESAGFNAGAPQQFHQPAPRAQTTAPQAPTSPAPSQEFSGFNEADDDDEFGS